MTHEQIANARMQEINRLRSIVRELQTRLELGRDYLMWVRPENLTAEDALIAFGYDKNGLEKD